LASTGAEFQPDVPITSSAGAGTFRGGNGRSVAMAHDHAMCGLKNPVSGRTAELFLPIAACEY